jgi:predicted RNA binding protein YcfA (HicA-like mRNA interferase family)
MPKPIKRREFIRRMRALGWSGPEAGHRHMAMRSGDRMVPIPNPHGSGDLDWSLVKRILKQAEIDPVEWEKL